jgi:hypothetical protein
MGVGVGVGMQIGNIDAGLWIYILIIESFYIISLIK